MAILSPILLSQLAIEIFIHFSNSSQPLWAIGTWAFHSYFLSQHGYRDLGIFSHGSISQPMGYRDMGIFSQLTLSQPSRLSGYFSMFQLCLVSQPRRLSRHEWKTLTTILRSDEENFIILIIVNGFFFHF